MQCCHIIPKFTAGIVKREAQIAERNEKAQNTVSLSKQTY